MGVGEAHSRLIAQAARDALAPLGIRRKGRSRTWLDDQGWWLGLIEFQPSSWSKGSYLNVGVMWLWDELPYLAYDVGYRVSDFERYEDRAKFEVSAQNVAKNAAQEASRYRDCSPVPRPRQITTPRLTSHFLVRSFRPGLRWAWSADLANHLNASMHFSHSTTIRIGCWRRRTEFAGSAFSLTIT